MEPSIFSPRVLSALAELEGGAADPLALIERLRRRLGPEEARAAAELHALRQRAAGRLPGAEGLLLTAKGLEQASAPLVARERAQRIRARLPGAWVWDATCGIGADSLALAGAGLRLFASDADALSARCARANLLSAGFGSRVARADASRPPLTSAAELVLVLDPDRRPAGGRAGHPQAWSPPFDRSLELAAAFAGACVKLPPAFDPARVDWPGAPPRHSWQWISVARELKEVALWTGALAAGDGGGEREVVALDAEGRAARLSGKPIRRAALSLEQAQHVGWIGEADPAVVRSGLFDLLAQELGARAIAPKVAYLAAEGPRASPLVRYYRVLDSAPLDPKHVRRMLAAHGVGPLVVKKRGHPDPAEKLAARLRGSGERPGVLIVARLVHGHRAFLVEPAGSDSGRESSR